MVKIDDGVGADDGPSFSGAFHFVDGADAAVEYTYDENGNMTSDLNRGISRIDYNCMNLPQTVAFSSAAGFSRTITYGYTADGEKTSATYTTSTDLKPWHPSLQQQPSSSSSLPSSSITVSPPIHVTPLSLSSRTDYCGNIIYENDTVSRVLVDGGYITFGRSAGGQLSSPSYHFYVKDHLGNNRVVVSSSGTVEETNSYYPFGGLMSVNAYVRNAQPYKYIGKELDRMFGWNMLDHGARWYNSVLARWETMDKLSENNYEVSPYVICNDNPYKYIDDDGNRIKTVQYYNVENTPRSYYNSPKAFRNAMRVFAQTSYGKKILSDFTPVGSEFFGVRGNGKYSDFTLNIQEESFTDAEAHTSRFGGYEQIMAQTQMHEGENGKPEFTIIFDLSYNEAEYMELITHEFSIHLAKYMDVLNEFNKSGSYSDALKVWQKTNGKEEHDDVAPDGEKKLKGSRIYYETKREMKTLINGLKK